MTCPSPEYCWENGCTANGCSRRQPARPTQPAVVPEPEPVPVVGIAMLLGLWGAGLVALVVAGVIIAGGLSVILGAFS